MTKRRFEVPVYFDTEDEKEAFRQEAASRGLSMSELGKRVLLEKVVSSSTFFLKRVNVSTYNTTHVRSSDPQPSPTPTLCECGAGEVEPGQTLCEGCATHYAWKAENEPGQPDPSPAIVDLSEGTLETVV